MMWEIQYSIGLILKYEVPHGLLAVIWCLPLWLALLLILITPLRGFWAYLMKDSLWRTLTLLAIGLLVVGLSWQSHVFADVHALGF
jgi:hypothetical protein